MCRFKYDWKDKDAILTGLAGAAGAALCVGAASALNQLIGNTVRRSGTRAAPDRLHVGSLPFGVVVAASPAPPPIPYYNCGWSRD